MLVICIASSCTTKNAQEKGTKKKTHTKPRGAAPPPEKYASSQGKKEKRKQIFQSLGALIICKATPLCLPFCFFFLLKKTYTKHGAVIMCNATSLCLLAAHMPIALVSVVRVRIVV